MDLTLERALRLGSSSCVAFIGAGGKTTAMFNLARELKSNVIVTATTHLGSWQSEFADQHVSTEADSLEGIVKDFQGVLLITGKQIGDKLRPTNDKLLEWIYRYCKNNSIPMLIEADGCRQKPLKAWAAHEPPIPKFADMVVQVVGLTGLGKPLSGECVHRPEIYSKLTGLGSGESITPDAIVRALTHPDGGKRNIPEQARKVILLNQADTLDLQSTARAMTPSLLSTYQSVIVASLKNKRLYAVHEPIAGIILAAGGSTRFGKPKQLLDWKGQPFVRRVVQTASQAGLSPIVVVTGSNAEQIESAIGDLDVLTIRNQNWMDGQGSSIREGVKIITPTSTSAAPLRERLIVGGAVFLLADQPQVTTAILQALMEKHAEGLHSIVAPLVIDRRANPVLFDRETFPDLMNIEGDTGGRAIFHKHRVEYLPWHDDNLLLDVDTPEQYQRLISNEDI